MIKFSHEGKLYRLKFFHDRATAPVPFTTSQDVILSRGGTTTAEVDLYNENLGEWELQFEGTAWCHPQDNFCKETGRRVALEDLFVHIDEGCKDFRSAINTAYWNRK